MSVTGRAVQSLAAVTMALGLLTMVLATLDHDVAPAVSAPFFLAFPIVASIVGRRQPRNAVVWCFLTTGLLIGVEKVGQEFGSLGDRRQWNPLLVHVAAWAESWAWFPGLFVLITVGLLRFPDGRLLSRRWRWVERLALLAIAVFVVAVGVSTWGISTQVLLSDTQPQQLGWHGVLFKAGSSMIVAVLPCVLAALLSLVLRYRRSGWVEREQTRWVLFSASIAIVIELGLDLVGTFGTHLPDWTQTLGEGLGFALIAITTGIAITRYKLYEIDRIVSRTVTYGVVLGVLVGVYVAVLIGLAALVPDNYGQVGVAAATLAVALLAVPLTRRVRRAVDHRFQRSRFDAEQVVAAFAGRLRARPERGDIPADLVEVLSRTVQPSHASVWLVPRSAP